MSAALLQVERLTLVSNRGPVVSDLSFDIAPGEIVALTGKSGSGKTSIALSILGLLPQGIQFQNGAIRWFEKDQSIQTLPEDSATWPFLRGTHIGYTQQDVFGAFDPILMLGKQMTMVVKERSVRPDFDIERELRIKMEEVGLHDIDRLLISYPHQLSGGQLQRCQIAMSTVIQPELLISDEPTSAIDKINQLELLDVFSMLRDKYNMAILCITHEEAVVRHLADREVQLDSLTHEFPLSIPQLKQREDKVPVKVLEVKGLEYTHTFGGMMYKQGATVGKLDFILNRGTCLGIVGESGSGKSTLAQLLVGLYVPVGGQVILDGKDINFHRIADVHRLRSKVQLVMQDGRGALHPNISIRDLLNEIGQIRKVEDKTFSLDVVQGLNEVGLPESILDRRAGQLSGGECLRVSLARALIMQPDVLICDESTSSLDGQTRDGIIDLLLRLMKDRALSLIFISHDERIIRGVADDVMVMVNGKVVEKGPAVEVIEYPTHPITKKIFSIRATLMKKRPH